MRVNAGLRAVLSAAALCAVSTAPATTLAPTPLPRLVQAAPSIVHGTVTETRSRWTDDGTTIVTDVTVRVEDTLRGESRGLVVFTQPGGRVGALRVDVPGASAIRAGEEAVFFLAPGRSGDLYLYGLDAGRFAVTESESGDKLVRGLDEAQVNALLPAAAGPVASSSRVTGGALRLSDFLSGIRRLRDAAPARDAVRDGGER